MKQKGRSWSKPMAIGYLKGQPDVIDTVFTPEVFIERMDKHTYFVRIGEKEFKFENPSKKGPGIVFKEA